MQENRFIVAKTICELKMFFFILAEKQIGAYSELYICLQILNLFGFVFSKYEKSHKSMITNDAKFVLYHG